MKLSVKVLIVLAFVGSIIFITFSTLITNAIVQPAQYSFLSNLIAQPSAWISYFGSIFGCIMGGAIGSAIGGYVAYVIALRQIQANNESLENSSREKLKRELEIETFRLIQNPIIEYRESLNSIHFHLGRLICFSVRLEKGRYKTSAQFIEISDYYRQSLNGFFEERDKFKRNVLISIFSSRRIILNSFEKELQIILDSDIRVRKIISQMGLMVLAIEDFFMKQSLMGWPMGTELLNEFNDKLTVNCNILERNLARINVEVPNQFLADLFGSYNVEAIESKADQFSPLDLKTIVPEPFEKVCDTLERARNDALKY